MARPKKKGVDYFPHDCITGKTIFILEQKFGNDGYAFWFKLLEFLGTKDGHYLDCNDSEDMEYLQAKTRLDGDMICRVLDLLASLNAIDRQLWGKRVVWSQRFVDGISDVYVNRRVEIPEKPSFYIVSTDQNPAQRDYNDESTSKSTQSKVKESKVKESKVNNRDGDFQPENLFVGEAPLPDDSIIGQMWGVWKKTFSAYTADREKDFKALGEIFRFMCRQIGSPGHDPTDNEFQIKLLNTLQIIADEVAKEPFWVNKPLASIANNIQEFYNKIKNPINGKQSKATGQKLDDSKLKEALARKRQEWG